MSETRETERTFGQTDVDGTDSTGVVQSGERYRVLACASSHPDPVNPYTGLFNARAFSALARYEADLSVVSPRPFAPPVGPYSEYKLIPETVDWDEYRTHYPRYLYLLPKRLFYSLSGRDYARRIPSYLAETFEVPDIVHAGHIYLDGYGVLPYCREYDVPMTATAHGWLLNNYNSLGSAVQSKVDAALDACSHLFCVSEELASKARQVAPETPRTVVPLGADPDRFPTSDAPQIRACHDIDGDETLVIFVGQFIERKGIDVLLDSIPSLGDSSVRFVLVGHSGDRQDDAEALAATDARVSVLDGLTNEELASWFAAADLLVLPSRGEGRPTVIYEAMASETAVLATDVGGVAEQVVDGTTGVVVPPDDRPAFERELSRLVGDRELLGEYGQNGMDRLHGQGWTWREHVERVAGIHRSILDGERQ